MTVPKLEINDVTGEIVDSAIQVHKALGPGLLERAYQACLALELRARGLAVRTQVLLPILYRGVRIEPGYRVDMLVEESVIVELKVVTKLLPVHDSQLLSYLILGDFRVGLMINFHEVRLKDGIRRMANGL